MRSQDTPIDLTETARGLLAEAHAASAGRAGVTLVSGDGSPLSQTMLALTQGTSLQEHTAPGPATILIVLGDAILHADGVDTPLAAGEWATIPRTEHSLEAVHDVAALLTVAPR